MSSSDASVPLRRLLKGESGPILALAPMQDVTDLPFWRLMSRHGGPDVYYTEYFRVHATSNLERPILESLVKNPTGRPAIAQMIGNDIPSLVRTAKELQHYPVAGIDLNLGCPAPIVFKKCAGGGLLRELNRVDSIMGALRDVIHIPFTVKTRIGFDSTIDFDRILDLCAKHAPDLVTVHARTVAQMYRSPVFYECIERAAARLPMPVLANGDVDSAQKALWTLQSTGAEGLMIGRGAIRNPWIFQQIRAALSNTTPWIPNGHDVLRYIRELYEEVKPPVIRESAQVQKMKRYMNYLGLGVDPQGQFLHDIRRAETEVEFFGICERFLAHDEPMDLKPFVASRDPGGLGGSQVRGAHEAVAF